MTLPNFLIIGAMKAGTTLLWDVLNQHPQVFMSKSKEPHYFSYLCNPTPSLEGDQVDAYDLATYKSLFADAGDALAIGEASTSYLHTLGVEEKIREILPKVKLICVLRDPIERAYSHYLWLVRIGVETEKSFAAALAQEQLRHQQGILFGRYTQVGHYHEHLQRYLRVFPRQQLYVCLFEDLTKKPAETYPKILEFLNVNQSIVGDTSVRRNPSGVPKLRWLDRLISQPNPIRDFVQPRLPRWIYQKITHLRDANLAKPPLSADIQHGLIDYFRRDIEALQVLLDRDLSKWLQSDQRKQVATSSAN